MNIHTQNRHPQPHIPTHTHTHKLPNISVVGKWLTSSDFQPIAKLDPCRPSRKFAQPKANDESLDDELKDKQAKRAQRLQALAEETFDANFWVNRKNEFANDLLKDEYVDLIHEFDLLSYLIELSSRKQATRRHR